MELAEGLEITRLRHDFVFCLDPGFWIASADRNKRLAFAHGTDHDYLARSLRPDHRVKAVGWARSLFEDARRRDHATLATINFEDIAPANVRLAESFTERVGAFNISMTEIRISRDGPIAFPFVARYEPEQGPRPLSISRTLQELMVVRESAYRLFGIAARYVFDIVASTELFGTSDPSMFDRSLNRTHRFEIIDFDYALSNGHRPALGELLHDVGCLAARELAGFIRMSRPEVWAAYREDFLRRFFDRNLGNRSDELWIFNSHCLVRHHPEEQERADVQLWFEDARLAMTILLQKGAALEYLYWVMKKDLNRVHTIMTSSDKSYYVDAMDLLAVVEELANRVFDPLVVERHVAHEFFRRLLAQAARVFEIDELSRLCRDRMQDVRTIVQAVAAQVVSSSTLSSAVATERLTRQMVWLSVLVTFLALAQIAVAAIALVR